jgi:hypothetical protein
VLQFVVTTKLAGTSQRTPVPFLGVMAEAAVANRPRFGCYSLARSRFSYTEAAERGGLGQQCRSNVRTNVLPSGRQIAISSASTTYMHTCLLRATFATLSMLTVDVIS